jgi:hypothetical protein
LQNCPSLYCEGFLAAFGGIGIADNYSGRSEYADDLPVIVDDGNHYGRQFFGHPDSDFRRYLSIPQLLRARFKVSANTVYLAGTGSVVILPSIPANSGR